MTLWRSDFDRQAEALLPDGWEVSGQILGVADRRTGRLAIGNEDPEFWLAVASHPEHGNVAAIGPTMWAAMDNLVSVCGSGDPDLIEAGNRCYIGYLAKRGWTKRWGTS